MCANLSSIPYPWQRCYLDLQTNFYQLKHNDSETDQHKVKQRTEKWHAIRGKSYVMDGTALKALGLDTLKKTGTFWLCHPSKSNQARLEARNSWQYAIWYG